MDLDVERATGAVVAIGRPTTAAAMSAQDFHRLTIDMAGEIADAIATRLDRGEDVHMAVMTVLFNIGDRFAPVWCIGGEWSGIKAELLPSSGIPKCPNGHVLTEGLGMTLGFIEGGRG